MEVPQRSESVRGKMRSACTQLFLAKDRSTCLSHDLRQLLCFHGIPKPSVSILEWSNFGWFGGTPTFGEFHICVQNVQNAFAFTLYMFLWPNLCGFCRISLQILRRSPSPRSAAAQRTQELRSLQQDVIPSDCYNPQRKKRCRKPSDISDIHRMSSHFNMSLQEK